MAGLCEGGNELASYLNPFLRTGNRDWIRTSAVDFVPRIIMYGGRIGITERPVLCVGFLETELSITWKFCPNVGVRHFGVGSIQDAPLLNKKLFRRVISVSTGVI
ncbi:hypothetical protein ANN_04293 [Periplaneta americana]|uniref:Per a allergen n=1 Tax=Periplaneta americana TaxID=6978 RepID=A0ABQ8T859_PERAM|nr:hypothetical protein ANN_04293 [Periplaneta americana]